MKKWEDFEKETSNYLAEILASYDVEINKYGNADSTIPDIEITINSNQKKFFVETKMPSSQTSQFVVEIENNKFIYGKNNKFIGNSYSDEIIDVLNKNFDYFKNVSQSGMLVPVPDVIAFGWVVSNMKNKNVEFITSVDNKNNEKIFSLEQFKDFFNIKTILRRKKSGSQNLPKMYYDDFKEKLDNKFNNEAYKLFVNDNKLFLQTKVILNKNECYIESNKLKEGKKYFLSYKDNEIYEVKLTSATNNPNIIFELSLKDNTDFDMFTIQCIIDYINENK